MIVQVQARWQPYVLADMCGDVDFHESMENWTLPTRGLLRGGFR